MNAPNRRQDIDEIVAAHKDAFQVAPDAIDDSRRKLLPVIVLRLQKKYGDDWKLLVRHDRGGRLTSDVICWPDTKEHIDVLSGKGAMWENHGPITDRDWELVDASRFPRYRDDVLDGVDGSVVPPQPRPAGELESRVAVLETQLQTLVKTLKDKGVIT